MIDMVCLNIITELDWVAIGSLANFLLAITAFLALYMQNMQFKKMRADENERAFKNSSVQLIIDFDKQFQELDERNRVAKFILNNKILEGSEIKDYASFKNAFDEIYDFFDTLGFYVIEGYIKAELVHQYFYHWFYHYYQFFNQYNIKRLSGYPDTVWINLVSLSQRLNEIEAGKPGERRIKIDKNNLIDFFKSET